MSFLDVGYLDPWGSLSFGLGFLIGWGHCFEAELHWGEANEAEGLLLNISTSPAWVMTNCCTVLKYPSHLYQVTLYNWSLLFGSTVKNLSFCSWPSDPVLSSRSQSGTTRPPIAPELIFTQTTPLQLLSAPLLTLIYPYLHGSMSYASDTWDTWDYSFVLGYPISGCSDAFQLKRPGTGAAVHDAWDIAWETDEIMMALWPRSVGIAWVNGILSLVGIDKLSGVWKETIANVNTGKSAFQSNSISLSLLPLPSPSPPGAAWDLVLTCGEQYHDEWCIM